MFFSISKQVNNDFPNHVKWGEFYVDFDNGWDIKESHIQKGYHDKGCLILYKNGTIEIDTGRRQTYPIFIDDENFVISNLLPGSLVVGRVTVTSTAILKTPALPFIFKKLNLTDDEIINEIDKIITDSILNFKSDRVFKMFLTGGVDTALLAAYVIKHNIPYELVTCEHIDLDYFMCRNRAKLKKFWAYMSLQHWKDPSILLSGASGDEMMLRNPYDAYLVLKHHGEDLVSECQQHYHYHNSHFLKSKNLAEFKKLSNTTFTTDLELTQYILDRNSKDFQHWHLGNTTTLTPFDNLDITNLMLNLSYPTLRGQLLDASVTKELIIRNDPKLLKYVSKDKNSNNFDSLAELFEGRETL
jgi:asparagine synthetase B (glutamine-hydrolysing)